MEESSSAHLTVLMKQTEQVKVLWRLHPGLQRRWTVRALTRADPSWLCRALLCNQIAFIRCPGCFLNAMSNHHPQTKLHQSGVGAHRSLPCLWLLDFRVGGWLLPKWTLADAEWHLGGSPADTLCGWGARIWGGQGGGPSFCQEFWNTSIHFWSHSLMVIIAL